MHHYNSIKRETEENLAKYGVDKNSKKFFYIYHQYLKNCIEFQSYVNGELDTFKKVACLMASIVKYPIVSDERENDKIALDICFSMIENPIWYQGPYLDQPCKLEPISIDKLKEAGDWNILYDKMLENIQLNRMIKKKKPIRNRNLALVDIQPTADQLQLIYNIAVAKKSTNNTKAKQFVKSDLQG